MKRVSYLELWKVGVAACFCFPPLKTLSRVSTGRKKATTTVMLSPEPLVRASVASLHCIRCALVHVIPHMASHRDALRTASHRQKMMPDTRQGTLHVFVYFETEGKQAGKPLSSHGGLLDGVIDQTNSLLVAELVPQTVAGQHHKLILMA